MSRPLAPEVPAPLRALLAADPGAPAVAGFTLLLLTVRDDGWPHQAMLSAGEVALAPDGAPDGLALVVWAGSTSTRNLRARERATLTAVVDGVAYALFLRAREVGELPVPGGAPGTALARFAARVTAASADEAPYARLEQGVRFSLTDPDGTVARWRATREALAR